MATNQPDWQIDHTVLDVFVTDRKTGKTLGRPKLKIKIDSRTRMAKSIRFEGPDDPQSGSEELSDQ